MFYALCLINDNFGMNVYKKILCLRDFVFNSYIIHFVF